VAGKPAAAHPSRQALRGLITALCLAMLTPAPARAHGEADEDAPTPGWQLTTAIRQLHADATLPSQALSGYLLKGDAGTDPRGRQLEHGAVAATVQAFDGWLLHGELGRHGTDPSHLEAAWAGRSAGTLAGQPLSLRIGRQMPAMGALWTTAGHVDRFGLMPLAKRAATDGDWVDDGAQLSWRPAAHTPMGMLNQQADVSLWQGHSFPGSRDTAGVPSLHWGASLDSATGQWQVDAFASRAQVDGRGARLNLNGRGHSHVAPVCDASLSNVVCFSGRSVLAGWSLQWSGEGLSNPVLAPLSVSAGVLQRRERGELQSLNGLVADHSLTSGQLLQAWWAGPVELGWRSERLMSRHTLTGLGAGAVAQDAGLTGYAPISRQAVALAWAVPADWLGWARRGPIHEAGARLSVESGKESQGTQAVRFTTLRLVVDLGGAW
jgi:hypothetical protein